MEERIAPDLDCLRTLLDASKNRHQLSRAAVQGGIAHGDSS
jgi:hypothetical protein